MFYTIGSISTLTVTIIDNDGKTSDCMYYSFEVGGLIFMLLDLKVCSVKVF